MQKKLRICLLFGGKSGEHEVSLQSAKSIYEALDKDMYEAVLVGIDKNGRWLLGDASSYLLNETNPKLIALNKSDTSEVIAVARDDQSRLISLDTERAETMVDVFFPIIHGTYGEDGSLQGMLELMGVAYVGAGVLGSAVGMDKDVMKRLLRDAGIPVARHTTIRTHDGTEKKIDTIEKEYGYPVFVKPANLGSSVGVSKAYNRKELRQALQTAFEYDTKVLVEEFIQAREIEVSVLGNEAPIVSVPGEVLPQHEFYSYEAKYIDEKGALLEIPAKLSDATVHRIQDLASQAFQALECSGMARVDFFVTEDNNVYMNEINTLPGFTNISMYPKLWGASGIPYPELLKKLISLAQERHEQKTRLKRTFRV